MYTVARAHHIICIVCCLTFAEECISYLDCHQVMQACVSESVEVHYLLQYDCMVHVRTYISWLLSSLNLIG